MLARLRPSPAMIVACIALLVALGSGAYAASQLPDNSVGTKQLKDRAVTNRKLAKGAVTAKKVAPHSLTGAQIRSLTLGNVRTATSSANGARRIDRPMTATDSAPASGAPGPTSSCTSTS